MSLTQQNAQPQQPSAAKQPDLARKPIRPPQNGIVAHDILYEQVLALNDPTPSTDPKLERARAGHGTNDLSISTAIVTSPRVPAQVEMVDDRIAIADRDASLVGVAAGLEDHKVAAGAISLAVVVAVALGVMVAVLLARWKHKKTVGNTVGFRGVEGEYLDVDHIALQDVAGFDDLIGDESV